MKKTSIFLIIFALICFFALLSFSSGRVTAEELSLDYDPSTRIEFNISSTCSYNQNTHIFKYDYELYSKPSSQQNIWTFSIEVYDFCDESLLTSPTGWSGDYMENLPTISCSIITWGSNKEPDRLRPGKKLTGFSCQSGGIPGIVNVYVQGYPNKRWFPEGEARGDSRPKWTEDSVKAKVIGPVSVPPEPLDPAAFVNRIVNLKHQIYDLGWIDNQGIMNSLDKKLEHARDKLQNGQNNTAKNQLNAFLNELNAQKGKHVNDSAYAVLKANVDYLISKI